MSNNASTNILKKKLHQLKEYLVLHEGIILILCFLVLLRIPNLFEPYWYGDEAIYLTIGQSMRYGLRLYAEIIDHKTPLIYYFAMVPSQFWFRILTISWMSISTLLFFSLTKHLKIGIVQRYVSTILFVLLTTLPWLEGNIPNGELFVMGLILMGSWFFARSCYFQLYLSQENIKIRSILCTEEYPNLIIAGFFMGLAILTKVPAIFDVFPFFFLGVYSIVAQFSIKNSRKMLFAILGYWQLLAMGLFVPILLSVVYFSLRGSGSDYLNFGLLYNFRYAGSWQLRELPFNLEILLSMKAKAIALFGSLLLITAFHKKLQPHFLFIFTWCISALFGALLSSRPYPHYLLQVIPPICLLIGHLFTSKRLFKEKFLTGVYVFVTVFVVWAIGFQFYSTSKYYSNFFKYLSNQYTQEEYYQSFDTLMHDNTIAASIISTSSDPYLFIWGTNPTLYALTKKIPTSRFTVSFHMQEFPGAYDETYRQITEKKPEHIVVMHNEQATFPEFFTFLYMNYLPVRTLDHLTIYRRMPLLGY